MSVIFAEEALLPGGWEKRVRLEISPDGAVASLASDQAPHPSDERHALIVPGMPNLHSHAFQYAMAGLAERRGPATDNFWSWRELMYRFALSMSPDEMEAFAARLYVAMLEAGFSRVGEFHYLHHAPDGSPYANRAEMAGRIASASKAAGINLTLLPVFYAHSNFGGLPPTEGQRRFIDTVDGFGDLLDGCRDVLKEVPRSVLGMAPHSLRAVTEAELKALLPLMPSGPIHMHAAEQVKEVEDSLAFSGARPMEWLLRNMPVDSRWCLIHSTHMTAEETVELAQTGAIAGLCPVTEANLGDGIFNGTEFRAAGGRFGIGSDSNVLIGVADELRQFEYAQRLSTRSRNVIAPENRSTGRTLFDETYRGGGIALGVEGGCIAEGHSADFVSLDTSEAPWLKSDDALDGWIFAGSVRVDSVWAQGVKQVQAGRHRDREAIAARFRKAMASLMERAG